MRRAFARALPLVAALPIAAAYVGGWATITVETLPDYLVVGQPTNLTFSVRQHGMHLLGGLQPTIEARAGERRLDARALPTNRDGYYTATLNVPEPGEWKVRIRSGFRVSEVTLLPIAAVNGLARNTVASTPLQRGQRLFVAKGCVTCHNHGRVPGADGGFAFAPDLTDKHFPREYLQAFLANPAVKPNWSSDNRMPNLNLKADEIAALIAFLNPAESRRVSMPD